MRECEWCGASVVSRRADAKYCSGSCRVAAHRHAKENPLPAEMLNKARWIRWKRVNRKGRIEKVPFTVENNYASSTDPDTWTTFAEASASTVGDGLGYVLGDGIGCIDLDHCLIDGRLTERATEFVNDYPTNYIEVSPSGDGLHIWGTEVAKGGTVRVIDGLSVERYSTGRYITITGSVYQRGNLMPL